MLADGSLANVGGRVRRLRPIHGWAVLFGPAAGADEWPWFAFIEGDCREGGDVVVRYPLSAYWEGIRRVLEACSNRLHVMEVLIGHHKRLFSQFVLSVVPEARSDLALGEVKFEIGTSLKESFKLGVGLPGPWWIH